MFLTIVAFIVILGILVFVHEFGHFITAKKSGMKVEEFGLGFPPKLWGFKKGGTFYSLNLIPIGGFVKIKGENGEAADEPDSFGHQPFRKKALVLAAGVLMNVVLAFILLSVGFMAGLPSVVDQNDINNNLVGEVKIQIAGVIENSAAALAGLSAGEVILEADGAVMENVEQFQNYIRQNQDRAINLKVKDTGGEIKNVSVTPGELPNFAQGKAIGVSLMQIGNIRYGFLESWYRGLIATFQFLLMIILAFYHLFKDLFSGAGLSAAVAGPVGVAVVTGQMVDLGFIYLMQFTALLSLNLAILNFLPFPALDGGRFIFLLIEKIRGRKNNQKLENAVNNLGFSLLMLAFIFITYRDIARQSGGLIEKVKDLF
ncbi:MAG TPA: site-2 protease family protein [Patescibacteria group bacterium]|nr:site-2 protease family protein [Patescibacteria group bacterium]